MKKLFVFLALIAYAFSDACDTCQANCKKKYSGFFKTGKRNTCIYNCISDVC